jgi:hypothetical protein
LFLPGIEVVGGSGRGREEGEKGGEMTQTLYAHMNKRSKKKKTCMSNTPHRPVSLPILKR